MATKRRTTATRVLHRKTYQKRRRSSRGLSGASGLAASFKPKEMLSNVKKAGLILAGLLIGKEGTGKFVPLLPGMQGEGFLKKYLPAAIQLGGGLVLASQKKEELRYLGFGMLGGGFLEVTSKLMNKDLYNEGLLSGLQGLGFNLSGLTQGGSARPYLPELQRLARQDYGIIEPEVIIDEAELIEE